MYFTLFFGLPIGCFVCVTPFFDLGFLLRFAIGNFDFRFVVVCFLCSASCSFDFLVLVCRKPEHVLALKSAFAFGFWSHLLCLAVFITFVFLVISQIQGSVDTLKKNMVIYMKIVISRGSRTYNLEYTIFWRQA